MKIIVKITVLGMAVFFLACKPAQKIVYNINDYQPSTETANVSVSIQIFEDIRSEFPDNQVHLQAKDIIAIINNTQSCINAERLYKVPVGQQLADMLSQYLHRKAYFANVLVNQKEQADYYITAQIKHFTGFQDYSTKAVIGTQFGLIGALATMKLKTEGKITIELSDICVYDKNNALIAQIGDFKKEYDGDFPVDAYCYCIYRNINQCLAGFNEELGAILFKEIKKQN